MLRLMGVRHLLAGILVAAAAAAACGHQTRVCTAIGAEPGVRIIDGEPGALMEVCDRSKCGSVAVGPGTHYLQLSSLRVGKKATLRTMYTAGQRVVTGNVVISPTKFQPNGPGCEPTVAVASIAIQRDGRAVAVNS
jgi:hypothetical protein